MQAKAVEQVNLFIVVWDNECYQSIGGPPTHASGRVDIAAIARGAGIENAYTVKTLDDFDRHCREGLRAQSLYLVVAKMRIMALRCFATRWRRACRTAIGNVTSVKIESRWIGLHRPQTRRS
jgi:thiamine pyrophosphate-dependent acetolactate synthase large subunit-like protein